jgi:hypothetical protein
MEGAFNSDEIPRDDFVVEILRYVVAHPRAKDTISGIERWWLSPELRGKGTSKTESVLNLLVTKGWLISRRSPQSATIYSLNEDLVDEVKEYLKQGN